MTWLCAHPDPTPCTPDARCTDGCRPRKDEPMTEPKDYPDTNAPPWVQSVTPAEIVRQRQLNWPDFHPEDFCHICGHRNPVWSAPAKDWDTVIDGHGGIFCPSCWADLFESVAGRRMCWWFATDDPAEVNPLQCLLDELRVENEVLHLALKQACADGWADGHGAMQSYTAKAKEAQQIAAALDTQ